MLKERSYSLLLGLSALHVWPKMHLPSRENMMLIRIYKNISCSTCLFVLLAWLGGCAGLDQYVPSAQPQLTPAQEARVGAAVEAKLIQLLGGPYHDKMLTDDLNRLGRRHNQSSHPFKISVADRSVPALYPLPGGRTILTRGLLTEVRNRAELESLLSYAAHLSNKVHDGGAERSMAELARELLSASDSMYDPDSAGIRLARRYKQGSCERNCLASIRTADGTTEKVTSTVLPESVKQLSGLLPGYKLLADAREFEEADDQAKAIATYLEAAATTPDEPRILGSLGLAYLRAGHLQAARLHLQKSVKLQPGYYKTQMGLGYLYLQLGKIRRANEALAVSVRMLPVTENHFLLAEAREKSGDTEDAMLLYQLVVESDRHSKLGRTASSRLAQSAGTQ